jgi:hypothetical protein
MYVPWALMSALFQSAQDEAVDNLPAWQAASPSIAISRDARTKAVLLIFLSFYRTALTIY